MVVLYLFNTLIIQHNTIHNTIIQQPCTLHNVSKTQTNTNISTKEYEYMSIILAECMPLSKIHMILETNIRINYQNQVIFFKINQENIYACRNFQKSC